MRSWRMTVKTDGFGSCAAIITLLKVIHLRNEPCLSMFNERRMKPTRLWPKMPQPLAWVFLVGSLWLVGRILIPMTRKCFFSCFFFLLLWVRITIASNFWTNFNCDMEIPLATCNFCQKNPISSTHHKWNQNFGNHPRFSWKKIRP